MGLAAADLGAVMDARGYIIAPQGASITCHRAATLTRTRQ